MEFGLSFFMNESFNHSALTLCKTGRSKKRLLARFQIGNGTTIYYILMITKTIFFVITCINDKLYIIRPGTYIKKINFDFTDFMTLQGSRREVNLT